MPDNPTRRTPDGRPTQRMGVIASILVGGVLVAACGSGTSTAAPKFNGGNGGGQLKTTTTTTRAGGTTTTTTAAPATTTTTVAINPGTPPNVPVASPAGAMYQKGTPEWVAAQETVAVNALSYQYPSPNYWLQLTKPYVTPGYYAQETAQVAKSAGDPTVAAQWAQMQKYKTGDPVYILRSDSANSSNPNTTQLTVVVSFKVGSTTGGVTYPPGPQVPTQRVALSLVKVGNSWFVNSPEMTPGN